MEPDIGTMYLYNIDTLHNIFLTVHGTDTRITTGSDRKGTGYQGSLTKA